jgi:tRNA threonylcarbamoyladenosine biosynthesis protein TsaB
VTGPLLLALDLTSDFGSMALARGEDLLEEIEVHSPDGYAHVLFGEIDALLARHSMTLRDLDGLASASGPGAFTGVRVGLAAVKGLAEALDRRVVTVSNLEALAWFGLRRLRAPVLDARRGDVFGAVYDDESRLVREEVVMKLPAWLATLPEGDIEIVSSGVAIPERGRIPVVEAPKRLAGAVARIAARKFAEGLAKDPAEIDANYVRRSDAELHWEERQKP